MNLIPEYGDPIKVIERQMRSLHGARQAEDAAKAALEKYDADDGEISQLKKLLADAQRRLDERMAADEARKELQTAVTVATERKKQIDEMFRAVVVEFNKQNPDVGARDIPGVSALKFEEEAVITNPEKALKTVMEQMWGVDGLLTINTEKLLVMHQSGLLNKAWYTLPHDPMKYLFGAVPERNVDGWYTVKRALKPSVETDFSKTIKKLEGLEINPAALIEVKHDKSA